MICTFLSLVSLFNPQDNGKLEVRLFKMWYFDKPLQG